MTDQLDALGITASEAARRMDVSKAQLSHVMTGRKPMPHTMCVKVAALLDTSAEFWATLQMRYDLWHAMHGKSASTTAPRRHGDRSPV